MEGQVYTDLTGVAVVALAALLCGVALERLRQPAFVGYIFAGLLLGPTALGVVHNREQIDTIADLTRLGDQTAVRPFLAGSGLPGLVVRPYDGPWSRLRQPPLSFWLRGLWFRWADGHAWLFVAWFTGWWCPSGKVTSEHRQRFNDMCIKQSSPWYSRVKSPWER